MIKLLILLVIVGVLVLGVASVVSYFQSGSRDAKKELRETRYKLALANSGLIAIVNGAGNPVLEATIVLSKQAELDNQKELN